MINFYGKVNIPGVSGFIPKRFHPDLVVKHARIKNTDVFFEVQLFPFRYLFELCFQLTSDNLYITFGILGLGASLDVRRQFTEKD